jgi:hypothetical protein
MKILSITVIHKFDDNPDLSWLGKYTNKYTRGCIDRKAIGDMGRNEYRYFEPANEHYRMENYKKYEKYNNGQLWCIGITAMAICEMKQGNKTITYKECSSGLWGIESDSGEWYIKEIEQEQLEELRYELSELGFSMIELDKALSNVERRELDLWE